MSTSPLLKAYLEKTPIDHIDGSFVAYLASLEQVAAVSPLVASHIVQELADQRSHLKLIASENYSSLACIGDGNLTDDKLRKDSHTTFLRGCEQRGCDRGSRLQACMRAVRS